jgi:hypothetical protein
MSPLETIILAAQKAQAQFSVIQGTQEDNAEIIKELSKAFIGSISELVHAAGGDNDYMEPWVDGIENDIDLCFKSAAEPVVTNVFKARRGLGRKLVEGARI